MSNRTYENEKADKEPEVELFGSKVGADSKHEWRHHHTHSLVWGIFLIFAGILLLLNTLNIIPWEVWNQIWQFWPVILILVGLNIIFGDSRVSKTVISLVTILLIAVVFLAAVREVSPFLLPQLPYDISKALDNIQSLRR